MNTKKSSNNGSGRTRNFGTIVYPESAPSNWIQILSDICIPSFISPLHDKDIDYDGKPKKEHYHVILMFDSVKTVDQAREVFKKIGGVGCEKIRSIRGNARYLCHLDSLDKVQYSPDDVYCLSGADYITVIGLPTDKYIAIEEMVDWCTENECIMFSELFIYARLYRRDWFRSLCDNSTMVMKEFLKSYAFELRKKKEQESLESIKEIMK